MKKRILIYIIIIFNILANNQEAVAQGVEKQKAIWIVNSFLPNCIWPDEDKFTEYTIGLLAPSDTLFNHLLQLSRTKRIHGLKLRVVQFKDVKNIDFTHAIYVGPSLNHRIKIISESLHEHTLLITDQLKGSNDYMINFLDLQKNRKKYEINIANFKKHGLSASRNIYIHGGKKEDLKKLFIKIKRESEENKQKYNKVSKELSEMTDNISYLRKDNIEARKKNEKQKKINEEHLAKINQMKNDISAREEQLLSVKKEINNQISLLNTNTKILEKRSGQVKASQNELQNRRKKIEEQNLIIQNKKKEIENKEGEIEQQELLLNLQKNILWVFGVLFVISTIMAISIWRSYVLKQRANYQLQQTNKEINSQKEEISHQHKHTSMLNKELGRLSIVASKTANAVTIMDIHGNFEWVNVGFTKIYGYTLQLLINELDQNLLVASNRSDIKEIYDECIATKETQVYESKNTTRAGDTVWVQTSLTPITDQGGEIIKLITIETDITHIKETESKIKNQHERVLEQKKELEASNRELEKLSLVAKKTENAIAIMNSVGDFQWINAGYSKLYGYSFEELVTEYSKNIITRDTDTNTIKLIKKSIEEKISVKFHRIEKHADGHEIYVQTTLSPILNRRNSISNLISVSTDISKLRETEQLIMQQNEKLIEQQTEIVLQKNLIDSKNQNINSSITYAKTIQNAILPPMPFLNRVHKASLIYKPLELVSGDFYWSSILQTDKSASPIVFYAVVDCTGHGVPGAFMSLIGSSVLDEIVNEKQILQPSLILESMNNEIQIMLRQKSTVNDDSMDVCLCAVQKIDDKSDKFKVVFAGAKRPLYYFTKAKNKVHRLKGTRKTIGGIKSIRNKENFKDHTIILDKGDLLYLSSDGITEQLSENLEKFGSKRFAELLQQISNSDIDTQTKIIDSHFANHVGNAPIRDDVCMLAVQI